jgi:hypothetical protein
VQCQNAQINWTNAQGRLAIYNVRSSNYISSGLIAGTWTQSSGTQPAIGNGTLNFHYSREGRKVTIDFELVAASATTFGNNGAPYFFNLPAPYDAIPAGNVPAIGAVLGLNAGALVTGVAYFASGGANFVIARDGNGAYWRLGNPGTWATGDSIRTTITYNA